MLGFGDRPAEFFIRFPMSCIETVITCQMLFGYVLDKQGNEVHYRNCFFKGRANAFFQFVQKSSLESFAEIGVVKVVNNSPEAVIGETTLGKKTMDMWIPLQGSAKGMQDANETRDKVPAFIQ